MLKSLSSESFVLLAKNCVEIQTLMMDISNGWGPKGRDLAYRLLDYEEINLTETKNCEKIKNYIPNIDLEGNIYDIFLPIPLVFGGTHSSTISNFVKDSTKKKHLIHLKNYTVVAGRDVTEDNDLMFIYQLLFQHLKKNSNYSLRQYALLKFPRI